MAEYFGEQFEKDVTELISTQNSDDTVKNRRNLMFASFIVISFWFLHIPLQKLKIFGAELTEGSASNLIIIGIVIIVYWFIVLIITTIRDINIHLEKRLKITSVEKEFDKKLNEAEYELKKCEALDPSEHGVDRKLQNAINELKTLQNEDVKRQRQLNRLNPAMKSQWIVETLNIAIPTISGLISLGLLFKGF